MLASLPHRFLPKAEFMRRLTVLFALSVLLSVPAVIGDAADSGSLSRSPRTPPNMRALVSGADLHYEQQVERSEAGLPIGNGRMGTLVWTSPQAIHLQINRGDVFAVDGYCDETVDYSGGCALIDIQFGSDVFPSDNTPQHLSVYDGVVTVEGQGVRLELSAWPKRDVIAVRIVDERAEKHAIHVDLNALRPKWARSYGHEAFSLFGLRDNGATLSQRFEQSHYAGKYICRSAVAVQVDGQPVTVERPSNTKVRLSLASGTDSSTLWIGSAAAMDDETKIETAAVDHCRTASRLGYQGMRDSASQWWADFWSKSFIDLHSEDGRADSVEQGFYYYLYNMASTSRGKYPAKFNGMLWSTGGDRRRWGSYYWWWNTQTLYIGLMGANHVELTDPLFDNYSRNIDAFATAARQQWDSKGIYIPETMAFHGPEKLPEDIAKELSDISLERTMWENTSHRFRDFAGKRNGFSSRWNFTHAPQSMPHSWVSHIHSSQSQIAWHYWLRYQYTGDERWLRDRAYPILRGIAQFYRTYPNIKKGDDGRYHIYGVNNHESVWGGVDTHFEITAIMGLLPLAIRASEKLGVDAELREGWQELLANLAEPPTNRHDQSAFPKRSQDTTVWTSTLLPAKNIGSYRPGDQAFTHFDLVTLETPDGRFRQIAHNTYDAFGLQMWGSNRQGTRFPPHVGALSLAGIIAANMGDATAVEFLLPDQVTMARQDPKQTLPNRMTLREGLQGQTVEHLGPASCGLQQALIQAPAPKPGGRSSLRVFAACPGNWDAHYQLLARGNFLIHAARTDGEIEFVEITAQSGGVCDIHNPWPNEDVVMQTDEKREVYRGKTTFVISFTEGERVLLTRHQP